MLNNFPPPPESGLSRIIEMDSEARFVLVDDPYLLFRGDYHRDGEDLFISNDFSSIRINGYFVSDSSPDLRSPNGASLDFDTVKALAGPASPAQFAVDGDGETDLVEIGNVISLEGTAFSKSTNGIEIELKEGDPVFQGDVIRTGNASDLGIEFVDKTLFSMSANATMVLDELVYKAADDPDNSMVFNLVEGAFVFVTGEIAPTGNMNIETPVATMGIRGTTPTVNINAKLGVTKYSILPDPGTEDVGSYVLISKQTGQIIGNVDSVGSVWVLTSLTGELVEIGKSGVDLLQDKVALDKIREVYSRSLNDRTELDGANSFGTVDASFTADTGDGEGDESDGEEQSGEDVEAGLETAETADDAPIARDDAFTTGEDAILTGVNVIDGSGGGADADPDGYAVKVVAVDGAGLSFVTPGGGGEPFASVVLKSGALLLITADGDITYDANDKFDFLGLGDSDNDTFTYTISDPFGFTASATVTITLTGSNDQPLITNLATTVHDGAFTELADTDNATTTRTTFGRINFADVDASDTHITFQDAPVVTWTDDDGVETVLGAIGNLQLSLTETPPVVDPVITFDASGNVISVPPGIEGNVIWEYTVTENELDFLGEGETLELVYTVTIQDDSGVGAGTGDNESDSVTQDVTIVITGTNDVPTITPVVVSGTISDIAEASDEPPDTDAGTQTATGSIEFADADLTDRPTATEETKSVEWLAADGVTVQTLSATQLAAIEDAFTIAAQASNTNNGVIDWDYSIQETDLDFLATGEVVNVVFTITITDDEGATATQDVTITLGVANDEPFVTAATDVDETLAEGNAALATTGSFDVSDVDTTDEVTIQGHSVATTGNDSDPAAPNEAALLAMLTFDTSNIIDGVSNDGTVNWNFDAAAGVFDYLAVGEQIEITYTVTVTDDNGATVDQDVVITITGTNDDPVIAAATDVDETLAEGNAALATTGSFDVSDVDTTDEVVIDAIAVSSAGPTDPGAPDNAALLAMLNLSAGDTIIGSGLNNGSANWSFNASATAFDYLDQGESAVVTYTVTISDGNGGTVDQDITITIDGVNEALTIVAGDVSQSFSEGDAALATSGSFEVTDVDAADEATIDSITVGVSGDTANAPGSAALLAMLDLTAGDTVVGNTATDGSVPWNFNAAAGDFDYLAAGEQLTVTYTVDVIDDSSASDSQDITITINGTNDGPEFDSGVFNKTLTESGSPLSTSGAFVLSDADISDEVSIVSLNVTTSGDDAGVPDAASLLSMLNLAQGDVLIDNTGDTIGALWTFDADATDFDYLDSGESVTITYSMMVMDDNGASTTQDITITIDGTGGLSAIGYIGDGSGPDAGEIHIGTFDSDTFQGTDGVDTFVIEGVLGEEFAIDTILDYASEDVIDLDSLFDQFGDPANFGDAISLDQPGGAGTDFVLQVDGVEIASLPDVANGDLVTVSFDGGAETLAIEAQMAAMAT